MKEDYNLESKFKELLNNVAQKFPRVDRELLEKAFACANRVHFGQKRLSGEPYIFHPLEVAEILASLELDEITIASALLHDVLEETGDVKVIEEELSKDFPPDVLKLVQGVTNITKINKETIIVSSKLSSEERRAENLRKIMLAMAKDLRVIFIKLADRLHNMRTLSVMSPKKQKIKAQETLEIYAPLASRLGMWQIKSELEDLAFRYLYPEEYFRLADAVKDKLTGREWVIEEVKLHLGKALREANITAQIEGRKKHLYSIFSKMKKQNKTLDEIYDLIAIRVIVPTIKDCYGTLGIVHGLWLPIPERIKDFIATPKPNSYRALHTTIAGPGGEPLEVQIRTWDMHRIAEFGIAAHWQYKENSNIEKNFLKQITPFIKQLLDWQSDLQSAKEFIQNLKLDFLENQVLVFTPNREIIDLPAGSTPVDFAYRIHTEVGHRCAGVKVNGRIVPLNYTLHNGDIVEIITTRIPSGPRRDWLNFCKTSIAKQRIKQWLKKEKREENIQRGKDILEKELRKLHKFYREFSKKEVIENLISKYNYKSEEDFLADIGYGGINIKTICRELKEEFLKKIKKSFTTSTPISLLSEDTSSSRIRIRGEEGMMVRFARCCNPLPGEPIIGYITLGKGVSIHRKDCPNLKYFARNIERIIEDVTWIEKGEKRFPVQLLITGWDRAGLLADLMEQLKIKNISAHTANAIGNTNKRATIKIAFTVKNLAELSAIEKAFSKVKGVISIKRLGYNQGEVKV